MKCYFEKKMVYLNLLVMSKTMPNVIEPIMLETKTVMVEISTMNRVEFI